VKEQTQF